MRRTGRLVGDLRFRRFGLLRCFGEDRRRNVGSRVAADLEHVEHQLATGDNQDHGAGTDEQRAHALADRLCRLFVLRLGSDRGCNRPRCGLRGLRCLGCFRCCGGGLRRTAGGGDEIRLSRVIGAAGLCRCRARPRTPRCVRQPKRSGAPAVRRCRAPAGNRAAVSESIGWRSRIGGGAAFGLAGCGAASTRIAAGARGGVHRYRANIGDRRMRLRCGQRRCRDGRASVPDA